MAKHKSRTLEAWHSPSSSMFMYSMSMKQTPIFSCIFTAEWISYTVGTFWATRNTAHLKQCNSPHNNEVLAADTRFIYSTLVGPIMANHDGNKALIWSFLQVLPVCNRFESPPLFDTSYFQRFNAFRFWVLRCVLWFVVWLVCKVTDRLFEGPNWAFRTSLIFVSQVSQELLHIVYF